MSTKDVFYNEKELHPEWSDFTCFMVAIRKEHPSVKEVRGLFDLVDKNDYDRKDKKEIIKYAKTL
jgi:hypothetical protein